MKELFQKVRLSIILIAAASSIALIALAFMLQTPTVAREIEVNSTLSVTGLGYTRITPDQVSARFTVEVKAENASEAMARSAEVASKVVEALKGLGLEDRELKTSRVSLHPEYFYPKDKPPVLVGYKASISITVTTKKLNLIGSAVDAAVGNGVNRVDGVWFTLSRELQERVRLELISSAVENARLKAEASLKPLGMTITGVKSIDIREAGWYPPPPIKYVEVEGLSITEPPIMPGEVEVTVTVYVVFYVS